MKDRPPELTDPVLLQALRAWHITPTALRHAPVGFGDHHWTATGTRSRRWFITIADLTRKPHCGATPELAWQGLHQAMATAAALPLDFVAAPLPTPEGDTLRRLGDHHAISVFLHLEGTAGHFGDPLTRPERTELLRQLAHLHATPPPPTTPRHWPDPPSRPHLHEALTSLTQSWTGGPFAEPARALLTQHAGTLRRRLAEFDHRATTLRGRPVLTHGEPHPGNVLRTSRGSVLLDWDTVALAVPERDVWLVARDEQDLACYAEAGGAALDPSALELYRLRWALEDVAAFAEWFRSPHSRTEDTEQAWSSLTSTLADLAHSAESLC